MVVALIIIVAGVVIDSLFSASWALDDGLLVAAAAVIGLALPVTRNRGGRRDHPGLGHVRERHPSGELRLAQVPDADHDANPLSD